MNEELFWEAEVEDIVKGYTFDQKKEEYTCLICGEKFIKGIIYRNDETFIDAERATKLHITDKHVSMFDYLINMNKKYTGLTDHQKKILEYFRDGLSDKDIIEKEGEGSTSTIRNHRFKFKEREKQAKIFLAIMKSMEYKNDLVKIHKGATMVDERYATTEQEKEKILKSYFKDEKLKNFPASEKKKIIVLKCILEKFKVNIKYTEKEVNDILKALYEDHVTLRRYLIEYGFMEREKDCSHYWVKI